MMDAESSRRRGLTWAAGSMLGLLLLTFLGSQGFRTLKLTEAGYLLGTFLFVGGSAYRMALWTAQPGVRMYLKGSLRRLLFTRTTGARPLTTAAGTAVGNLALQRFIWRRDWRRGLAHFCLAWGCLLSFALTIPLVLGMMKFRLSGPEEYQMVAMGIPLVRFPIHSLFAEFMFNALNLSAVTMVFGLALAYWNRAHLLKGAPESRPGWDMTPLHLLLAVGLTGLAITGDSHLLHGRTYQFWAIVHQITVFVLMVWLPWSKLFHFLMRPLAVSVKVYQQVETARQEAGCKMCGKPFISRQQAEDLKAVLGEQGISLPVMGGVGQPIPDRQMIDYCPDCKRLMRARRYVNLEVSHP